MECAVRECATCRAWSMKEDRARRCQAIRCNPASKRCTDDGFQVHLAQTLSRTTKPTPTCTCNRFVVVQMHRKHLDVRETSEFCLCSLRWRHPCVLTFATNEPRLGISRSRKRRLRAWKPQNLLRSATKSLKDREGAKHHRRWPKEESAKVSARTTTLLWSRGWIPIPFYCYASTRSSQPHEKHSCVLGIDEPRRSLQTRSRTDPQSRVCGDKE